MRFLYHPDIVLTVADLESLAVSLLSWLSLPGIEGCDFDPGDIWRTVARAAVGQKSIKAVTDDTLQTYSDDYTLAQLHTIPAALLEEIANDLLAQQAAMILGPARSRIICLDLIDLYYHGGHYKYPAELCSTTPRNGISRCQRYCAAFVLVRSKPLIVAVTAVRGDESRADASSAASSPFPSTSRVSSPIAASTSEPSSGDSERWLRRSSRSSAAGSVSPRR